MTNRKKIKKIKKERERERETKILCRGKMKNRWDFKNKFKIFFSLRSGVGVYAAAKYAYAAAQGYTPLHTRKVGKFFMCFHAAA